MKPLNYCQAQPQALVQVGGWVGFYSHLIRPPTHPVEFNLAPIEQYLQNKSC